MTANDAGSGTPNRLQGLLLALVLLLSAFVQFTVVSRSKTYAPLRADAGLYFSYAWNMEHYGVYSKSLTWDNPAARKPPLPDALTTPGYPLFLRALPGPVSASTDFVLRVTYFQALLGVLSVWLAWLIAKRLLPWPGALAVALLAAVTPHLATISTYVLTESLFYFLLLASSWATLKAIELRRGWVFVAAGLLWGACSLVRATTEFLPFLLAGSAWLLPALAQHRKHMAWLLVAFLLVEAPWVIRNRITELDPNQPNLVVSFLHHGSYPDFMYQGRPESRGYPYRFDPDNKRITRSVPSVLSNIAGNFRREPLRYARWYLFGKPVELFSWDIINGFGDIYTYPPVRSPFLSDMRFAVTRAIMHTLHWPLMVLGLVGMLLVWLRPQWLKLQGMSLLAARAVAALVLYAVAFHMIGAPFPRYGIPFRVFVYMLGMLVLFAPLRARPAREAKPTA